MGFERKDVRKRLAVLSEEMSRVAVSNCIVHAYVSAYGNGQCTWQEALEAAVVTLADQNAELVKLASKAHMRRPIILTTPEGRVVYDPGKTE